MKHTHRSFWLLLLLLAGADSLSAQVRPDTGFVVVRLGRDTIAVERWVIAGSRLEAVGVSRSPRTAVRRLVARLAQDGSVTHFATGTGEPLPAETAVSVAGAIPVVGQFYSLWEVALRRARRAGGDSVLVIMATGNQARPTVFRRTGPNAYTYLNQFDIETRARLDAEGRIQMLDVAGGTTVERARALDVDALAREFARRDETGRGLGALSPRDTARATVQGAAIQLEYGRPSLRGRDIRVLVPWDQVWRTGANNASELRTDRALVFGAVTVPAGTYSLFTLPRRSGWTLIINRQTGQSGLDYDASQDVIRVEMRTRENASHTEQFTMEVREVGGAGAIVVRWGTTEASAPFTVAR
jgi:hypothetical protein